MSVFAALKVHTSTKCCRTESSRNIIQTSLHFHKTKVTFQHINTLHLHTQHFAPAHATLCINYCI